MSMNSKVERRLFPCPEIDCADTREYPHVSGEDFYTMETITRADCGPVQAFPYLQRTPEGVPFIAVYYWDITLPEGYVRFLIRDGYRMILPDEELFLKYIMDDPVVYDTTLFAKLEEQVKQVLPQWDYPGYIPGEEWLAMMHLYHVSHRNGKEAFFREGLINIGHYIVTEKIHRINLIGNTPEKILGLPLRLLKILEQTELVNLLTEEESIALCCETYKKYSRRIGRNLPNSSQWYYLMSLSRPDSLLGEGGFDKRKYDFFGRCDIGYIDF